MRTTKTVIMGSGVVRKYILCSLSDGVLNELGEYWREDEAEEAAAAFMKDTDLPIVILTRLIRQQSSM